MSGLDVAAGVIAVVQISAKVVAHCAQYSREVADAKSDIARLSSQLQELDSFLNGVQKLLNGDWKAHLTASHQLQRSLDDCHSRLMAMEVRLKSGKSHKVMQRFGLRALRWPFSRQKIDKIVRELRDAQATMQLALQIDTTKAVQEMGQDIILAKLNPIEDAAFDSYRNQHEARCHPNTRVDLLNSIRSWADDPEGEIIYWLCGMAGTGKSTIAYTVAQDFADREQLGASFFFKRGEGDRASAKGVFATLASQMLRSVPALMPAIRATMDATPNISEKQMRDQFEGLLLCPLQNIDGTTDETGLIVIVIDAMDECENESDIKTLLSLLTKTQVIKGIQLRIFVTSRPELPLRLGFKNMAENVHRDVFLHEIAKDIIDSDLSQYLADELDRIRKERLLGAQWPGTKVHQDLVQMASPLFIFAATTCRFIGDSRWDPSEQLDIVLRNSTQSQTSKLYQTYSPIFERLLTDCDEEQTKTLIEEFQRIVGSIIILEEPLPQKSISKLFQVPEATISRRLDALHSVLDIPDSIHNDRPIRILHLSFRDFLLNPQKQRTKERERFQFWVDNERAHNFLAKQCLDLLGRPGILRGNICSLERPGTLRETIEKSKLEYYIPLEVQYACRYWVFHVFESKNASLLQETHDFLRAKMIYWIEAMSLLSRLTETLTAIEQLGNFISSVFLHFYRMQGGSYLRSDLQLSEHPSRLIAQEIPKWILQSPETEADWSPLLATLECRMGLVLQVAFSPDGKKVATAGTFGVVGLWDAESGTELGSFANVTGCVQMRSMSFSQDGKTIACAYDDFLGLWDTETQELLPPPESHDTAERCAEFSPDGKHMASGTADQRLMIWSTATVPYRLHKAFQGHVNFVIGIRFLPDGKRIASLAWREGIRLWDMESGMTLRILQAEECCSSMFALSPDGKLVASEGTGGIVRVRSTTSGKEIAMLGGPHEPKWSRIFSIAFSHCGNLIYGTELGHMIVFDVNSATRLVISDAHSGHVFSTALSQDGKRLISGSLDGFARIWDFETAFSSVTHSKYSEPIWSVALSLDGTVKATGSLEGHIRLHQIGSGIALGTIKAHEEAVTSIAFSPDSKKIASGAFGERLVVSDIESHETVAIFEGQSTFDRCIAFSPDGSHIACGMHDNTIQIWDAFSGAPIATLAHSPHQLCSIKFSLDGQRIISRRAENLIEQWDISSCLIKGALYTESTTKHLHFSADVGRSDSNQDRLTLEPSDSASLQSQGPDLRLKNHWIMLGSEELLWLPADNCPLETRVEGDKMTMTYQSGAIDCIQIDLSKLDIS